MLAAEVKNAERANKDARLIPDILSRIERLGWIHWRSRNRNLQMAEMPSREGRRQCLKECRRRVMYAEGVYASLGALREELRKNKALCTEIVLNRAMVARRAEPIAFKSGCTNTNQWSGRENGVTGEWRWWSAFLRRRQGTHMDWTALEITAHLPT